jgi:hypothetical protein
MRQMLATERFPPARELDCTRVRGQALLPPHRREGQTSTRNWLKHASLKLRASITGEASARGERPRELGKQARERINVDFDVDNPNTPP